MVWHRVAQSIFSEARQREDVTFTVQEHHCALKYLYGTKSTAHIEPGKCFCWWWRTVSYATYNKNKLLSAGRNWLYKSIGSSSVFLTLSGSARLEKANSKALWTRGALWPAVNDNSGTQAVCKRQKVLSNTELRHSCWHWLSWQRRSLQRNSRDSKGVMPCRK